MTLVKALVPKTESRRAQQLSDKVTGYLVCVVGGNALYVPSKWTYSAHFTI